MKGIDIANMPEEEFHKMMSEHIIKSTTEQRSNKTTIEFDNVIKDDCEPYKDMDDHLGKTFQILNEKLPNFYEYTFIVHGSDSSELPNTAENASWVGDKKVLIWASGEHKHLPVSKIKDKYHHIFANYYWDNDYVTSFPLGCFSESSVEYIPMEERMWNINFVGCLNKNRLHLSSILSKIPSIFSIMLMTYKTDLNLNLINHMTKWLHPKDFYKFTPDFAKGFTQELYLNLLHSSKISLCPRGWTNSETFRLYESMRAGCVTIAEKLPDRSYYKDIPVIQVDNWEEGLNAAKALLKDENTMKKLGEASKKFYEEKLSPEATAKIIMDKLAEKAI